MRPNSNRRLTPPSLRQQKNRRRRRTRGICPSSGTPGWSGQVRAARKKRRVRAAELCARHTLCLCSPADLDTRGKVLRVLKSIVKFVLLVGLLYLFVCSLDILSSAFQLVGGNEKLYLTFITFYFKRTERERESARVRARSCAKVFKARLAKWETFGKFTSCTFNWYPKCHIT